MITDHIYREAAPYLGGKSDDVYWAELNGKKYYYGNGKWMFMEVPAGWDDTVTDKETLRILNEELDKYRKENNHA